MNKIKFNFSIVLMLILVCQIPFFTFANGEHGADKSSGGGKVFTDGSVQLQLEIEEEGKDAYFLASTTQSGTSITPDNLSLTLTRLGGKQEMINFKQEGNLLRSTHSIQEPQSFDVAVQLEMGSQQFNWQWQKYERRVSIPAKYAQQANVTTAIAAPGTIEKHLELFGELYVPPNQKAHASARFSGVAKQVYKDIGDEVKRGDKLATVEANDSLQNYTVTSPIDGRVIKRNVSAGEVIGNEPLFLIVNDHLLWAKLKIFPSQQPFIDKGMIVHVLRDGLEYPGKIAHILPSDNNQPYQNALVYLSNEKGELFPGQLVTALVDVETVDARVRIESRAIQILDGSPAVFVNSGHDYEARPVEVGLSNESYSEVLSGLNAGERYVVDNSYLIKADIEKSGTSHAH